MNIVLLVIIAANVLISYKAFNDNYFFRKYEFHIGSIRSGEQFRMFSSAFLHVDFTHLLFNMFTLYIFAPFVITNVPQVLSSPLITVPGSIVSTALLVT